MTVPVSGDEIDGFVLGDSVHDGSMARLFRVRYRDDGHDPGFPLVMKVPHMTAGDGAENIVSFEVEHQILQVLEGSHVPRFVAAGDLERLPYLVMEYVPGQTLQEWMEQHPQPPLDVVAEMAGALAQAVHRLHQQNVTHLDLKPANVLLAQDGRVVLLDFGLSRHAQFPDLLAEELRRAVGSPAWMAPEQVVGVRGDPRSDVFAIGVMLYQFLTGELPFGEPQTSGGLRQRLWMDPIPPRWYRPNLAPWMQEVVLRCLEPQAERRYPSAAHLAFDLQHPQQVRVSARGQATRRTGFWTHLKRWLQAAGADYQPSALPEQQINEVPIVMVAVPNEDVSDATLYSLRQAAGRALGTRPGARLACVTVISPHRSSTVDLHDSEVARHRRHLHQLRHWAQPLERPGHQVSCHVLEAGDVAQALLAYARGNHVHVIVMGAATHGLRMQRLLATVPIRVATQAPCTVVLVKQALPFDLLGRHEPEDAADTSRPNP